ncbi:hypothetical protein MTR67_011684 [Solanum verrucosum]|uniref:ATP-dependent DNA helicase n=1 Tax=Solanum verrucosum TaxID=315347 RepID=A0AAF0Q796_SOLVR|nr:hypothetical protein MTR67_011684 [Solanum verrucosum]
MDDFGAHISPAKETKAILFTDKQSELTGMKYPNVNTLPCSPPHFINSLLSVNNESWRNWQNACALLAAVRFKGFTALATATSGVAASVLPGGRTAHSRFKLPLDTHEYL